ncbi:FIST C-terminal domain-containing protein [Gammaproteobacteria bacterium]
MKIRQATLRDGKFSQVLLEPLTALAPHLLLVFGAPAFFATEAGVGELGARFPDAALIGCSTAGEVSMQGVQENTAVITAVRFEHTRILSGSTPLASMADSLAAGQRLARAIAAPDLQAVLVFGQGVHINGSALVEGMTEVLGTAVPITGGLAGDNGAFRQTWTLGQQGVSDRAIVAIGLAGKELQVGHGSFGGWESFGPARQVTRCEGNLLYELDGKPALDIYKYYLGEYARDLPSSGLLFPFAMLGDNLNAVGLIRTILGIDEQQGSLTLAGEIRQNGYLKLMHASTDTLVDGAEAAARAVAAMTPAPALAILVSCVGRKLVMGDRVDEEVEAVAAVLGQKSVLTGFYSYGEISPLAPGVACQLHNQTMTITTLLET